MKSFFWKGKGDVITADEMDTAYNQAADKDKARKKFIDSIAGKLTST